jgi:hypothetical protein
LETRRLSDGFRKCAGDGAAAEEFGGPAPVRASCTEPGDQRDVGMSGLPQPPVVVRVSGNVESMTILEKLRSDHQESLSLLATIMAASAEEERDILFKQFLDEFIAHSRAAESQLYERLGTYEDSRYISLYAKEAHDLAVSLADDLATDPHKATERWTARCQLLKSIVEQHMQEEENSIFTAAKAVFDIATLRRIGSEFAEEKRKHLR